MKALSQYLLLSILCSGIHGCKEVTIVPKVPSLDNPSVENRSPGDFTVKVDQVRDYDALLRWGPTFDVDDDKLYHIVYLGDSVVARLTDQFSYRIFGLQPQTDYNGKIIVTDSISEPKQSTFNFKTHPYFQRFDRVLNNYEGRYPECYNFAKTSDGGYVLLGDIGFNLNGTGLFVLKIDSLGYQQWYSAIDLDEGSGGGSISQTSDAGFIISNTTGVLKLDALGQLEWSIMRSKYNISENYYSYKSAIELTNGDFMVAGYFINAGNVKKMMIRCKSTGEILWQKYYEDVDMGEFISFVESSDGNFIVLGSSPLSATKITDQGDILWNKNYGNSNGKRIIRMSSGGYVIAANNLDSFAENTVRILRIDEDGNTIWDNLFRWSPRGTTVNAVVEDHDGGVAFTGGDGDGRPQLGLLVKLTGDGSLMWKKTYRPSYIDFLWQGRDLLSTDDTGFIIMGIKGWIFNGPNEQRGIWIKKTDNYGE